MNHQTAEEKQINNVEVIIPDVQENGEMMALSPIDMPIMDFTEALNRRELNRKALLKWIKNNLVRGIDYGSIHIMGKNKCQYANQGRVYDCHIRSHWSKDSLFKPGAEKICGMMGLSVRYPNISLYEEAVINGLDIKTIILKCELYSSQGIIVGEGIGARSVAKDYGDINKSLKMASKSAMIDATLRVAGLSQIFTQDIEDMFKEDDKKEADAQKPVHHQPEKAHTSQDETSDTKRRITSKLYNQILSLSKEKGMTTADIRKWCVDIYGVVTEHLRIFQAHQLIGELKKI